MSMAMQICREIVRQELRRKGHKLQEFSFKHLCELAQDYLLEHVDEVLDQAHDRLAEIEREVRARLTTLAQQRKHRNHSTIPVQISGAK
jgi:hypothetical protein